MANRMKRDDLARYLGVAPATVSSWKYRHPDFPQPVGRYYDIDAVIKWDQSRLEKQVHHEPRSARVRNSHKAAS